MRALRRTLTLLPFFMGCAHPAPVPASDPDDPYAALERLSREIDRSVAWARAASPSRVPRGDAAGALNILRLLLRSIDEEIAWADTERPYFVHQDTRFAKLALGNPDNLYTVVRVDDDGAYRISGQLGTTADFAIQLYQGYPGVGRPFAAVGSIDRGSLQTDAEGRFEVIVSAEARDGNWIRMLPDTRRILLRYTYGDWHDEVAGSIRIERIGPQGTRSTSPDGPTVAEQIDAARFYLRDALRGYLATVEGIYAKMPVNTLQGLRRTGAGGLTGQYGLNGHYAVDDDHALIVTTRPSEARYQGFQIGSWWFAAFDYANRITSLNTEQAHLGSDGRYRFVVSTRDPGVPNWIDASGNPEGLMLLRWQGAPELGPEHQPELTLVAWDEILDHFPADVPHIDTAARAKQIAARKAAIDRRFGLTGR